MGVLTLATWNVGPGTLGDLIRLRRYADVIALQEAGDRSPLLRSTMRTGWKAVTGVQPGQPSTPLIYDPAALTLLKPSRLLLAAAQDVGPGAGPDRLKAKWLIGGRFLHQESGRRFWLYSTHYVATQGKPKRHRVALAMSSRIALLARRAIRPVFVMGDFNAVPGSAVLRVLKDVGMVLAQLVGRPVPTHGRRAIDGVTWTPRRWIRLTRKWPIVTNSDHRALVADFDLQPKRGDA